MFGVELFSSAAMLTCVGKFSTKYVSFVKRLLLALWVNCVRDTAEGTAAWEGDKPVILLAKSTATKAVPPSHFCLLDNTNYCPPFSAYEVS